ncbi:GTPase-activating protein and vps9 domain-containing protein 1-like [Plakobranchus ocellatus]|uniref:GTPase-activating protein and vps9 domain-containing protein 1-like n=1 Tax=Plakobranchus ocellatus TaxID=259542 RepID=A0AAV3YG65_9GAST|nr:GTPase-activating protein and vps9 domain-containing protein 1-like [Plakobranchus ocellatus]
MSLTSDLLELSQQLQQEHLFVSMERESLQRLFHNVTAMGEQLFHTAWVASQQKLNLQQFMSQGIHAGSTEVYGANNQLEVTNFVDSYKVFSYHDSKYGELIRFLYERPTLLAMLIIEGEEKQAGLGDIDIPRIIGLTVTSVYGSCLFHEDEQAVLRLLKTLLDHQVANSDNPRRLVRRQSTAFSRVYKHLCESLFSARLFLTAALYDPIMRLLMEDEWFFDIDPDKALVRFAPAEKLRRFGEPGTEEHTQKQAQYRAFIVDKLVFLAMRFINSIKANIQCFPASLGWLVSQVYRVLTERGQVSMQEVRASCADLVFALFICPAICDPEPHGITSDVPISHIARHNLMQMAQIIQVLAMSQWEEIDPKVRDIYGKFEKGCMSSVLDLFLEGPWDDITEQIAAAKTTQATGTSRSAVLLTADDIKEMISFLRNANSSMEEKSRRQLEQLLSALPVELPSSNESDLLSLSSSGIYTPSSASPETPGTPTSERKLFKSKGTRKKRSTTLGPSVDQFTLDSGEGNEVKATKTVSDVLVLTMYPPGDCPGMLPEKKVLLSMPETEVHKNTPSNAPVSHSVTIATPHVAPNPEIQEKRTRFSLSHDQESIGNTSDYQEVISEAASSHSVEDDEVDDPELETEDNFSDMMSANVSGRGSPSISGRDTPLSQAGSVEENNPPAAQLPVPVPETVRKQNRVDVTERFGKFEIKAELALERDECKSTVSDTWSTDVLASDSEPPESNQVDRLEEVAEEMGRPGLLLGAEPLSEISETASDAWSTDVLASDTDEKHSELLKDLEQDLLGGALDRDFTDSSLINEEGDDSHVDMDTAGAVGGGHGDGNDAFSDVFNEDADRSSGTVAGNAGTGGSGAGVKRISNIVHHFQSGPNLQLPSTHRLSSQSLKHSDNRGHVEGNAALPTVSTSSVGGFPAGASPSSGSVAYGGARSKVREKRNRRGSSGGGGGDDSGMINEFDPLASHGGGRRNSRDKITGRRGHYSIQNTQNWVDHPGKPNIGGSVVASQVPTSGGSDFPPAPLNSSRSGRTSSRDSGIDIWVSTNGQMSGNSPASRASLDSSPGVGSPRPLNQQTASGRASLDSNLQRLHHSLASQGHGASPDSGLQMGASQGPASPPLEIISPLFAHLNTSDSVSAQQAGGGHSSKVTSTPSADLLGLSNDLSMPSSTQPGGNAETNLFEPARENSPLMLLDGHFEGQTATGAAKPLQPQHLAGQSQKQLPGDIMLRHPGRKVPPQIQVTNIFKTITRISSEEEGGEESHGIIAGKDDGNNVVSDSLDVNIARPFEQQTLNLNERRLSSALTSGDSFTLGTETDAVDATSNQHEIPAGALKDLSISFNDSVSIIEEEPLFLDDRGQVLSSEPEPLFSVKSETAIEGSTSKDAALSSTANKTVLSAKGHHRDDSSGSNQSGSSLKLSSEAQGRVKEQVADNVSLASDEKDFGEFERSKKTSSGGSGSGGFLRSMKDRLHKVSAPLMNALLNTTGSNIATPIKEWSKLERYGWEILPHPAHSPDLAPSDFYLFGLLKRHLGGMAFETEDDLISELRNWFDNLDVDFFRFCYTPCPSGMKKKSGKLERDSENPESDPSASPKLARAPLANAETTDDILAKYRTPKKPAASKGSNTINNNNNNNNNSVAQNNNTNVMGTNGSTPPKSSSMSEVGGAGASSNSSSRSGRKGSMGDTGGQDEAFFDPANLESCRAFLDAKRKLRLVLSMGDVNFGLSQVSKAFITLALNL